LVKDEKEEGFPEFSIFPRVSFFFLPIYSFALLALSPKREQRQT
jgi:hypothetical protein